MVGAQIVRKGSRPMNYRNSIPNGEGARIAAGAAAAFIFVGLLAVVALAILWTPPPL